MKPKPTPGPWTVDQFGWCAESETWDNQDLIAASPDLLEALKECRKVMMMEHVLNPEYGWLDFINKHIQPAIDKAEGGTE